MPPKVKVTKNDIVQAALQLYSVSGESALNARSIATALACSTQPIFSNFDTMEQLRQAVIGAAYERYQMFLQTEVQNGNYPQYKSYGMAYIRFAEQQKELFRLLFMRDRTGEDLSPSPDFEQSMQYIMQANGVSQETAWRIHMEIWACVHGIATMIVTSFLPFDWEMISGMLSDVYRGICARHTKGENNT